MRTRFFAPRYGVAGSYVVADHERRRRRARDLERAVERVAVVDRIEPVVELGVAVVPPEVLVLAPRALAGVEVRADVARVLLLGGADA